jgi:hypothetical protein
MCPPTRRFVFCDSPDCDPPLTRREGGKRDFALSRRSKHRPRLEDIWSGFSKNIESFKLRAAAGCVTGVAPYTGSRFLRLPGVSNHRAAATVPADLASTARLDNTDGTDPKTRPYEIPRRKDDKVTRIEVFIECPPPPAT